jgi:hypothetical protein
MGLNTLIFFACFACFGSTILDVEEGGIKIKKNIKKCLESR